MEELKKIIGKNIQHLRKDRKLTQNEFANELNYTAKAISKWERGESIPEIETLIKIADFFHVTVDYLLHENSIIHSNEYLTEDIKDKNKYFTMGLAVSIVWIVATVIFVYFMQQTNKFIYQTFMLAVPISVCVIAYYVKNLSKVIKTIIYSILLWVVLACIYIQFIEYNLYLVFIIGIPAQLALFLWSKIIVIK